MTNGLIVRTAFIGSVVVAASPVLPQDADEADSLRQRLRVEQEFGVGENLGLESPREGRTSLATTRLTYGLESSTAIQQFSMAVGGALRFGSVAEGNNAQTGFTDPVFGLRYNRDTGNATFAVDADYRQTDISLAAPLWTFLDSDGIVRPPRDFSDIRGSGERRSYSINTELETGREAPFGLRFFGGASGTDYIDATDADLIDFDNRYLGLSTLFRFDSITTGVVDLRYSTYGNEGAEQTDRDTQTIEVGFDRELTARSSLTFRIGYTDVDTTETSAITGQRVTTQRSGPSGRIGYLTEMSNGTFDADLSLIQNDEGERGTLRFTRSLSLPRGDLSANIGLSSTDSTDPRVIGGVYWTHELPSSEFTLRFDRDVFVDSDDEDRFSNILLAGYRHDINDISSLSADMSLSHSEATSTSTASRRGTVVIVYDRQLTEDWSLNTGVAFSVLDEDPVGRTDSSALFFGIGRNFDW